MIYTHKSYPLRKLKEVAILNIEHFLNEILQKNQFAPVCLDNFIFIYLFLSHSMGIIY